MRPTDRRRTSAQQLAGVPAGVRRAALPSEFVPGSVVPRLAAAFAAMTVPVVLVLDDMLLLDPRAAVIV